MNRKIPCADIYVDCPPPLLLVQYHYPAIAPLIQEVCKEYKVDYKVLPDFTAAFNAHIKHLQNMGEKGIPAEIHMG